MGKESGVDLTDVASPPTRGLLTGRGHRGHGAGQRHIGLIKTSAAVLRGDACIITSLLSGSQRAECKLELVPTNESSSSSTLLPQIRKCWWGMT
ncbi:hypothetical protein EYF80_018125 [Liparis tanakae]|uniref:Uncharacterized protein n=1 Tax=Liparis tanakae TaxID=230148 RepID=A0A4Z2I1B6_9TELE|nr:hypothetical protein EYF80_018125 [Liparis tanakae]